MGRPLQAIKTAMVFLKKSCDTLWVLGGYPPGITGKGDKHKQAVKKTKLEKLAQVFMFSSEVSDLEEVCPQDKIVNWKLHEIFHILTVCWFDV